jgi:hypothetical protein
MTRKALEGIEGNFGCDAEVKQVKDKRQQKKHHRAADTMQNRHHTRSGQTITNDLQDVNVRETSRRA